MKTEEFQVNGPVNTVRLEGKIGDIKKVVYLFMDFHISVQNQTECDNIRSIDIDKYIINTFDKALGNDKTYDLIIERDPIHALHDDPKYKGRYLFEQTYKMFHKASNIDPMTGIVGRSKELKNVRLHYSDIRGYTTRKLDNIMYAIQDVLNKIWNNQAFQYTDLVELNAGLNMIYAHMLSIYKLIYEDKNIEEPKDTKIEFSENNIILSKYTYEQYRKVLQKIIYKLLKRYNNKIVDTTLRKIINNEIHNAFKEFFNDMDKILKDVNRMIKFLEPYKETIINDVLLKQPNGTYNYGFRLSSYIDDIVKLYNIYETLYNHLLGGSSMYMMDLYLLKRLLDKDYITNAVIYTGAAHSLDYIRLLVKYFDFKITHYSYLKDDNIKAAEKYIKESKNEYDLGILFFPPEILQCSILRDWPKNFL